MLSSAALEHQFGNSNPLYALMSMTGQTATGTVAFLLGAGLLREEAIVLEDDADVPGWDGLLADMDGIDAGTVDVKEEAARIGRKAMRLYEQDTMDASPIVMAIVKAADVARPLGPCARCDHALGDHGWFEPCTIEGCTCEAFTRRCEKCRHFLVEHAMSDGKCTAKGCSCRGAREGKDLAPASTGAGSMGSSSSTASEPSEISGE